MYGRGFGTPEASRKKEADSENIVKCFYHSADLDGWCSGAIVQQWAFERGEKIDLIPFDYGQKFPIDSLVVGEKIFMVDVSLPSEEMEALNDKCDLIWIDHHKTAINDSSGFFYGNTSGVREVGKAACELAWGYCFPEKEIPRSVFLLGRYDVWDLDAGQTHDDVLGFQYFAKASAKDPQSKEGSHWWSEYLDDDDIDCDIYLGKKILQMDRVRNEMILRNSHMVEFEGFKVLAVNTQSNSLMAAEAPDRNLYDVIAMWWQNNNYEYVVSLRSTGNADVGELAKRYGGGGHTAAAGYKTSLKPFPQPVPAGHP